MTKIKDCAERYLLSLGCSISQAKDVVLRGIDLMGVSDKQQVAVKFFSENESLTVADIITRLNEFVVGAKSLHCTDLLIAVDSNRLLSLAQMDEDDINPMNLEWMLTR